MPIILEPAPITSAPSTTVTIPHLAYPFQMTAGGPVVVEQGSADEIRSNILAVCVCGLGDCPELPTFGIPDPTFSSAPPDPTAIIAAITQWEPRANTTAIVSAVDSTGASSQIALTGQYGA